MIRSFSWYSQNGSLLYNNNCCCCCLETIQISLLVLFTLLWKYVSLTSVNYFNSVFLLTTIKIVSQCVLCTGQGIMLTLFTVLCTLSYCSTLNRTNLNLAILKSLALVQNGHHFCCFKTMFSGIAIIFFTIIIIISLYLLHTILNWFK